MTELNFDVYSVFSGVTHRHKKKNKRRQSPGNLVTDAKWRKILYCMFVVIVSTSASNRRALNGWYRFGELQQNCDTCFWNYCGAWKHCAQQNANKRNLFEPKCAFQQSFKWFYIQIYCVSLHRIGTQIRYYSLEDFHLLKMSSQSFGLTRQHPKAPPKSDKLNPY